MTYEYCLHLKILGPGIDQGILDGILVSEMYGFAIPSDSILKGWKYVQKRSKVRSLAETYPVDAWIFSILLLHDGVL